MCRKWPQKQFLAEDIKDAPWRGEQFAVFRTENVNRLGISPGKGAIVPPLRLSADEEIIAPAAPSLWSEASSSSPPYTQLTAGQVDRGISLSCLHLQGYGQGAYITTTRRNLQRW